MLTLTKNEHAWIVHHVAFFAIKTKLIAEKEQFGDNTCQSPAVQYVNIVNQMI